MTIQTDAGDHGHDHTAGANSRSLGMALALTSLFLVAELVGAWWFNSLALLSDASHMFTDSAALAIALLAIRVGLRPPDDRRTYGYRRMEVLAAAFNSLLLFAVAAYILYEGALRFFEPQPVQSTGMLVVATVGLAINIVAMRLLSTGKEGSLNIKGAYLEVWSDMLGSIGVIAAAIIIRFTGWTWVDPVVAVAIGLWVLPRTWVLLRASAHVLMQGTPTGLDIARLRTALVAIKGVAGIDRLHAWTLTGTDRIVTLRLSVDPAATPVDVVALVERLMQTDFGVDDVTVQVSR